MNTMLGFSFVSQHGPSRYLQALLFFTLVFSTTALNSGETWSKAQTSSAYKNLPECARTCIAQVDNSLSCWSYGCVCSENTVGKNFIDGANYVQKCVRDDCPKGSESVVNNALDVFQSICEVEYFEFSDSTTATVTATIAPTATPTFDASKVVMIDKPDGSYKALDSCVRWVLNGCDSPKDNKDNCKPARPGNHGDIWTGLGAYLQCSTAECVCGGSRFFYSSQKLYERADLYCSIGFPYEGSDTNQAFQLTLGMLADYCSTEGFVLGKWIITLFGTKKETGMTQETKVAIGFGVLSGVLTIISIALTCCTLRRKA
ncbi:hypothetical protein CEP51_001042 [Fusarium floridanum]|uniref:CFEM domain-containing protein n=1 Tax=Fusarium floridanum TaxID=1325733 RepID=A0A428SJ09_9HYPO|nr:hypothetical protein CEP51_001042 [Fusarium floridanum]